MQKFKINELRPHPRNNEFFDDMSGEKWQEFLESIKTSGVIEPIVVTQDKVIVSGHQRVRACKELGIEEILAEVKVYDNEDDIIKDLLETNIRQRGDIGGSTVKLGRRIKELERIYGVRHGGDRSKTNNVHLASQEELAHQLGINLRTLQNAKTIANLPQEIQDLVEQGNITPSTASRVISKLSDEEQAELIESLPVSKKLTQKEVEGYIEKLKEKDNQIAGYEKKVEKLKSLENDKSELEKQISDLKNQEPKEIIKEVIPDDYDKIKLSNKAYRDECKELQSKYDNTLDEIAKLKHQIKELSVNTKNEMEFNQKIVDSMNRFTNRVNDFISDNGGFAWIIQHISELPSECKGNIRQFLSAIKSITDWANDTNAYVEQVMTEIKNNGGTK